MKPWMSGHKVPKKEGRRWNGLPLCDLGHDSARPAHSVPAPPPSLSFLHWKKLTLLGVLFCTSQAEAEIALRFDFFF